MAIPILEGNFGENLSGVEIEIDGKHGVVVNINECLQRRESAAGHELGHFIDVKKYLPIDVPEEYEEAFNERFCAAVMLPFAPFRSAAINWEYDLDELARLYPHASREMMAMRIVETVQGTVAARWSGSKLRWRYGDDRGDRTTVEQDAVWAAMVDSPGTSTDDVAKVSVTAWVLPRSDSERWRIVSLLRKIA